MKCKNCDIVLEKEQGAYIKREDGGYPPNAMYLCPECGFSAIWVKGSPLQILFDPYSDKEVYGIMA